MSALRALGVAFAFLTLVPVKLADIKPSELGRAVAFFPVVGLFLGGALFFFQAALSSHLPSMLVALCLVALSALLTGGLHLDGVADVFDGLGGGRGDRERMLRIMRDSHIGAHGTVALVLLLIGKVIASSAVVQAEQHWSLLAAPLVARTVVVPLVAFVAYARPEGLGRAMHDHAGALEVALALFLALLVLTALGPAMLVPALFALGAALGLGAFIRYRIGGLTGDAYGAVIEFAELSFLMASVAV